MVTMVVAEWDRVTPSQGAQALFHKLPSGPNKRLVEIGEVARFSSTQWASGSVRYCERCDFRYGYESGHKAPDSPGECSGSACGAINDRAVRHQPHSF